MWCKIFINIASKALELRHLEIPYFQVLKIFHGKDNHEMYSQVWQQLYAKIFEQLTWNLQLTIEIGQ